MERDGYLDFGLGFEVEVEVYMGGYEYLKCEREGKVR